MTNFRKEKKFLLYTGLLWLLIEDHTVTSQTSPRPDFMRLEHEGCQYIFTLIPSSYSEAVSVCEGRARDPALAIVKNLSDFQSSAVANYINNQSIRFYVGAQRIDGVWRWSDSSIVEGGVPSGEGDCAVLGSSFQLQAVKCSSMHRSICERKTAGFNSSCRSSVCQNNETCIRVGCGYRCDCTDEFEGKNCENTKSTTTSVRISTTSSSEAATTTTLRPEFIVHEGCQYIFSPLPSSYSQAVSECEERARDPALAIVKNPSEFQSTAVANYLNNQSVSFYVGARKIDGVWRWSDSSIVEGDALSGDGDCAVIQPSLELLAVDCSSIQRYICERIAPMTTHPCDAEVCQNNGACTAVGCSYRCDCTDEFDGAKCQTPKSAMAVMGESCEYYFTRGSPGSYDEAMTQCQGRPGNNALAVVDSVELRGFARTNLRRLGSPASRYFVGARRMDGVWRWLDYSPLNEAERPTSGSGNCAVMMSSGGLRAVQCSSSRGFICESSEAASSSCSPSICNNNQVCVEVGCRFRCDCDNNYVGETCDTTVLMITSQRSIEVSASDVTTLSYEVTSSEGGTISCELSGGGSSLRRATVGRNGRFEYQISGDVESTYRLSCFVEVDGREHTRSFETTVYRGICDKGLPISPKYKVLPDRCSLKLMPKCSTCNSNPIPGQVARFTDDGCVYRFFTRPRMYDRANETCAVEGAVLAVLKSEDARRFAMESIRLPALITPQPITYFVGARRRRSGVWRWEDASPVTPEPRGAGDCSAIRPDRVIIAVGCSSRRGIICQTTERGRSACTPSTCSDNGVCVEVGCHFRCNCANNYAGETCDTTVLMITSERSIEVRASDVTTLRYEVTSSEGGTISCEISGGGSSLGQATVGTNGRFEYRITGDVESTYQLSCSVEVDGREHTRSFETTVYRVARFTDDGCVYRFFTRPRMYDRANETCAVEGAVLAVLKSEDARRFARLRISHSALRTPQPNTYFVGARRRRSGVWRWEDTSAVSPEPKGTGNCSAIQPDGAIIAVGCSSRRGIICQTTGDGSCASDSCQNGGSCVPIGCSYRCQCFGNYRGSDCSLDILSINSPSRNLNVLTGENATLMFTIRNPLREEVSCTFNRSGRGSTPKSPRSFSVETREISRTIMNVRETVTYRLRCTLARDSDAYTERGITIIPTTVPPSIFLSRPSYEVRQGSNLTVPCTASGSPRPKPSWRRMTSSQELRTSSNNNRTAVTLSLLLNNAQFGNTDTYVCEAGGASGRVAITVVGPPVLHSSTRFIAPIDNNRVEFECVFEGNPAPDISWQLDGGSIPRDHSQFDVGRLERQTSYRRSLKLTVYGVECKGTSLLNITCSASNGHSRNPVVSERFFPDITLLPLSQVTTSCAEANEACRDNGAGLVVVPSNRMMRIINSRIRNTQRPSSPYWISSQSARYISRWYSSNTNQREPNPDGCLRTIMAGNGSPRWVPNQSSSSIPVCEVRTTPLATVMSTKRFLCDGTRMEIEWRIIRGASSLEHRVYLDGEIETSIRTRPGVNSTTLTELKPRDKYNVQVLPLFMGCAGEYLPDEQVLTTGRGDLSPPTNLRLLYSPEQKSCIVTWDDEAIVDGELGYFNVSIRRERRSGEDSLSEATYERVDSGGRYVIEDPSPYSNYHVAVGSVTTPECAGRIQPAWTEVVAEGCLTPARGPGSIELSGIAPTADEDGVVLTLKPINEVNGPISCIAVVVQKKVDGDSPKLIVDIPTLQSGNRTQGVPYIAWVATSFDDDETVRLGGGATSCCNPYSFDPVVDCDSPSRTKRQLSPPRLLRGENRDLDSQANYTYYIMTATPSDGDELIFTFSDRSEPFTNIAERDPHSAGLVAGIVVVLLLIAVVIIVLIILYKKKRCCFERKAIKERSYPMEPVAAAPSLIDDREDSFDDENIYENDDDVRFTSYDLSGDEILNVYVTKTSDEDRIFIEEFKVTLSDMIKHRQIDYSTAQLPENSKKNRYKNILPSEPARVLLATRDEADGSDYINASFINGYSVARKFIAAQGPKKETSAHFWSMVVEQGCRTIAMVTLLKEGPKEKCVKYWPDVNETKTFGDITVTGQKLVSQGEFVYTTMTIHNKQDDSSFELTHFQYLSWPDHGIPGTTSTLLRFHKAVCKAQPANAGPIVVHCSAGVGRTGTLIALDILSDQLAQEGKINVFEAVHNMRLSRNRMVQNIDQYKLLHKMLAEVHKLKATDVDASKFISIQQQLRTEPGGGLSGIERQFQLLDEIPPSFSDTSSASKPENRSFNADSSVLPYDHNLAFVGMTPTEELIPYVNASNMQTYTANYFLIAAQDPIPSNIHLFWRCILDNKVSCVVMVQGEDPMTQYWADGDEPVTFHDIIVRTANETQCKGFLERSIEARKEGDEKFQKITQLVVTGWPKYGAPPSVSSILEVVGGIESKTRSSRKVRGKTFRALIHCRDGSSQAGTVCAIYNLIERVKNENMVDVFRTVKDLRDQRAGAVGTAAQFGMCYSALSEYIQSFDLYANFK